MAAPEDIPAVKRLGFKTRLVINPVTETVATTATEILRNNPDRIFWLVVNLSGNNGYVGWDNAVSSTRGLLVAANGGFVSANIEEDGELVIYPVYAVNLNAAGTYMIVEVERI